MCGGHGMSRGHGPSPRLGQGQMQEGTLLFARRYQPLPGALSKRHLQRVLWAAIGLYFVLQYHHYSKCFDRVVFLQTQPLRVLPLI